MKALLAVFLLLPLACLADEWNKHFDVSGKPELHVFAGNLPVEIRGGSNSGIDVELKTEGFAIGPSEVHVDPRQEGNRVELRAYMPADRHFNWGHNSVRLIVHVPKDLSAFVESENGPVALDDISGDAHLTAGNGPIAINNFDGNLESQSENGPVKVHGRFDALKLHMGNGPLSFSAEPGSKLASDWRVETGNGPISIRLPHDVSADVSIHTGNGPLSFDLPVEQQTRDDHTIHGKLNGGGPELTIETGHGPVSIGQS